MMPEPELDDRSHKDYVEGLRGRFGDIVTPEKKQGRWATLKDRLAMVAVVLVLALLGLLMVDGWVVNFRCTFAEFVTFECNRWAGEEHPSLRPD